MSHNFWAGKTYVSASTSPIKLWCVVKRDESVSLWTWNIFLVLAIFGFETLVRMYFRSSGKNHKILPFDFWQLHVLVVYSRQWLYSTWNWLYLSQLFAAQSMVSFSSLQLSIKTMINKRNISCKQNSYWTWKHDF